mmetsp:Transcript_15891/g.49285  ORF Transcript_15891/g.49285 Transcript_15891/m.49285 type:complete len:211 (-) Transcript_15891:57-689(-)
MLDTRPSDRTSDTAPVSSPCGISSGGIAAVGDAVAGLPAVIDENPAKPPPLRTRAKTASSSVSPLATATCASATANTRRLNPSGPTITSPASASAGAASALDDFAAAAAATAAFSPDCARSASRWLSMRRLRASAAASSGAAATFTMTTTTMTRYARPTTIIAVCARVSSGSSYVAARYSHMRPSCSTWCKDPALDRKSIHMSTNGADTT